MYICMYVCMYVRMYVCMYVCMYVHVYVCCMYVRMYVCTYIENRGNMIKSDTNLEQKSRELLHHSCLRRILEGTH